MELINTEVENYAAAFTSAEDQLLAEISSYTLANHPHHHMLSGHVQGMLLQTLSCLLQPKNILEIGTFTGYSALCLARGLQAEGTLHTIELREVDAHTARGFFSKSLYNNKIVLHEGNALDIIPTLPYQWDMIFLDADKVNYINYYELTLPVLKPNGVLIADNVMFHGKVLQQPVTDKNAKAIRAFSEHVARDSRVEQVMLTIRDGVSLIRKL
ncbi:MAG: O-methyltransferase [Ginsengibacter sp.]